MLSCMVRCAIEFWEVESGENEVQWCVVIESKELNWTSPFSSLVSGINLKYL